MSRFKDTAEHKTFIDDSDSLFNSLLAKIPVDNDRANARVAVNLYYDKWSERNKLFIPQQEKNTSNLGKIEKLYEDLKNSIEFSQIDTEVPTKMDTIKDCKEVLINLRYQERRQKCQLRVIQYQAGDVFLNLRKLTKTVKNFKTEVKNISGYSLSHAYYLMKFYKTCQKFRNLKHSTLSTEKLKSHLTDLTQFMKDDIEWWNQPCSFSQNWEKL